MSMSAPSREPIPRPPGPTRRRCGSGRRRRRRVPGERSRSVKSTLRSRLQHEPGQHRRVRPRRGWRVEAGRLQFHRNELRRRNARAPSTAGCAAGMRVTSVNWATRAAASLPIVPEGATISGRRVRQNHRVAAGSRDERGPARRLVGRCDGHGQRPGDPGRARFRDAEPLSEFQIPERDFRGQILVERRLGQGLLHAEHQGRRQETPSPACPGRSCCSHNTISPS